MPGAVRHAEMNPDDKNAEISPESLAEAVRWNRRTRFNPLAALTPGSLTRALDGFERGELREAAILWDAIVSRDDTIPAVKSKREKSVAHKPLETVTLEKGAVADAHREVLTEFWKNVRFENAWDRDERGGVQKLIRSMQSAVSYKYAAHHIVWKPTANGLRATFEFVPLWFFDAKNSKLMFNPSGYGLEGTPLERTEWMVSVGDGLMFAASIGYFLKRASLQDWLRFSEKFAMPGVLGKTSAAKDSPEGVAMRSAVEAFGNEWAAVLYGFDGVNSAGIELIQANGNPSAMPMPALIERVDRKIAAMYRGADLSTMSSGGDAEGTGASLQGEEQDILERADAADRSEELQAIERTVIEWTFGAGVEPLAQTRLIVPEREDQELLLEATKTLVDMGARIPMGRTLARFGISEADEDEVAFAAPVATVEGRGTSDEGAAPVAPDEERVTRGEAEAIGNAVTDADPVALPVDDLANLLLQSAVDGFGAAMDAGNTATTDAIWKDGETNGGDRVPAVAAANAGRIGDDDGWYQIAPYGEFPTNDGKYIQVFGPEEARKMVKHFNSAPVRLTRWLWSNEVPVFIGHPDIDPKRWADERKLAVRHTKLEAREDGLWGQADWNDLGRENLANGYWQYPSPVWLFPNPESLVKRGMAKLLGRKPTNRIFPDVLRSVGLTNFQNIPDARRVTHNAGDGTTQENDEMNLEQLAAALGLEPGATMEDCLSKIESLKEAAEGVDAEKAKAAEMETKVSAMEKSVATANAALQDLRKETAGKLLDTAIGDGKITLAERGGWERRFETDYTAAANAFAEVVPAAPLNTERVTLVPKPDVVPTTPGGRIAAFNAAVQSHLSTHPGVSYDAAVEAVKADPKMKPVVEAMRQPKGEEG